MMQGKVKEGSFEGLFAGALSEHQHLGSLINFKQCGSHSVLAILAYWFIREPSACSHVNIEHMLYCFQSPSCISQGKCICRSGE